MKRITHRDLMLATAAKAPFAAKGWIFELTYDGFRCLASKRGKRVRLVSRNGRDMTAAFPELVADLRALPSDLLELDGQDHRMYPLVIRKAVLAKTLAGSGRILYASHFENSAAELWALAKKFDLEGVVAKDGSSVYEAGRTTRWQKIKTQVGAERERQRLP